jgi:1-deoxy-D-xylulose-5-phosphate reductoisomerase
VPAAFNAANEVAVERFLDGRIRFGQIANIIDAVLAATRLGGEGGDAESLESVLGADADARRVAREVACS